MDIKLQHRDGDFEITLVYDQTKFDYIVTALEHMSAGPCLIWCYVNHDLNNAIGRYLRGIADECACYGSNHDQSRAIESMVLFKIPD